MICEASLSHHTLCMENLVWFQEPRIHVSRISLVGKKKVCRHTDFEADQKPETFLGSVNLPRFPVIMGSGCEVTKTKQIILESFMYSSEIS